MTSSNEHPRPTSIGIEAAMAQLDEERRKVDAMQKKMSETTTTVQARDRIFSITLDGRGDLTKMAFDGTRYRRLPPAELASLMVETLASGRRAAMEQLGSLMDGDVFPGLSYADLAMGKIQPADFLNSVLGDALDALPDRVRSRVSQHLKDGL